jgi:formamidopyrimidine-DNA glycosylase
MPEGLEVYVLARVLRNLGIACSSHGKHLLVKDPHIGKMFDISFGLEGKIKVSKDLKISKVCVEGKPCGKIDAISDFQEARDRLGIDWVSCSRAQLLSIVKGWGLRKKNISALLVDQSQIAGIGRYWVKEILRNAMIDAKIKAHTLDFLGLTEVLVDSMIKVRDKALENYMNSVPKDELKFVNEWFKNLYVIRTKKL